MALKFDEVKEGDAVFIPGAMKMGRVLQTLKRGHRTHQITVVFVNDQRTIYRRGTWFAVRPEEAPAASRFQRIPAVDGGEPEVAIFPVVKPVPTPPRRPFGATPVRTKPKKVEASGGVTERVSVWPADLPDIPGPPVPRPIADVWTPEVTAAQTKGRKRGTQTA